MTGWEEMDELLVKGKDNILMLIQALQKARSHANNGCGARKSAATIPPPRARQARRLEPPGAAGREGRREGGHPWKGVCSWPLGLAAGQLLGASQTFLLECKIQGGGLNGKRKE